MKRKLSCENLIGKIPQESEYDTVIEPPVTLLVGRDGDLLQKNLGVYLSLSKEAADMARDVAMAAAYTTGTRTYGLPVTSAVFGTLPKVAIRQNYCRFTRNSVEQPELLRKSLLFAEVISDLYEKSLPSHFRKHQHISETEVLSEWLMPGTPFSTINYNLNNAIRYHRDKANQSGVMSNVIIVRSGVSGGMLVLPEYRVALSQTDGAIIIFDGQQVVHGVTPIVYENEESYRCSIVLYTLNGMKDCYPFGEELERAKINRTRVEDSFRTNDSIKSVTNSIRLIDGRSGK